MGAQIVKANLAVTILWIWCLVTTETNNCSVPIVTDETGKLYILNMNVIYVFVLEL